MWPGSCAQHKYLMPFYTFVPEDLAAVQDWAADANNSAQVIHCESAGSHTWLLAVTDRPGCASSVSAAVSDLGARITLEEIIT